MDRGKQSEQMIHMINYLNGQCKDGIEPAKLIMGNHELFYLDSCYEGYAKSFSTNNGGNCIYGDFPLYSKKIYCKKAKSLEKAVKKAVDNGTLTLAYGKGTTIFSHVVITREMVTDLAQALIELAKERRGRTDSEPAAEKIDELAKKFTELSNKIGKNESFNENDASSLAKGLNEFLSMRSKIFKDFDVHNFEKYKEDPEKYYSIDVKPFTGLNPNNNSTEAEKKLFNLMNSGAIEKGITWNRIENVKKEDQLIPGLKYIVGHDADEKYRTMEPSKDHGERVILADSKRSSGYNSGETRANYAIIKPESLSREKFASDSAKPKEIVITKEATARGARTAYSEYSKKQPKTIAAEKPAVATKESPAKVIEGTAIDPAALTEEKPKKATTTVTEAKVIPEVIPQWLKKDDEYKLRRQEFIEQFESEIDRFSNPKDKREKAAFKKRAEDSLSETFDIIWSSRKVSPYIDRIKDNDTFFETDLNGDMAAFLNTLCDTKAVKYKDGEDALIFYNPDVAAGEEETYTLDKLAYLKTTDAEKHKKLMEKLQPLPNVVPTTRYSRYVNCGNFMGRGMQSEQMIHMINYLHGQCKDDIKPAKLIMGNHELSYLDRCPLNYIDEGNCIYGKLINKAKPIFKKAESLEKAVKKAVDNGALTLAHSQGTTIFSHTVITKSMVKDFAEALTELAKEKESSADSEPDVEKIKELAKKFTELSNKIKNNKLPFNEGDATNLAKGLNEFLSMRSKIFKKHFDSIKINPNLRFTGLSWNDDTYTKAETKLFNLMNSYGEKKGGITWNEIKNVPEDQLIPGLKYIVGHDAKKEYSSMEPSKEHGNKVILADCYRSYVFNDYKTRTNYAVIEPEFLSGKEFVSAPKITADTIIRYNIAEVAEKVYKQYMDEKETSEKSNATAVTEENKTEASEKLNATAVTTEKPPVVTEEDKTEGTREIKYVDKSYYKGDFSNGRKNGRGKFVYTDSSFYEGGFVNGIRRGNGMLVDKDKKYIFFGKWRETGKEMEGSRLNLESGIVETGTFKFKDSKGCEPLAEGTIIEFDSNISNDGNGTLENIRGALQNDSAVKFLCKDRNLTISQESSDNKKDLVIQINQSDKTVSLEEKAAGPEEESAEYSISYKDGKIFNGNTKMEYLDGSSYEGDFKNGRKNGKGKFIYTDKSFYEGDFVDGVRIGGGILVDKDKKYIFFGNWKEDGKEMDGSRLNLESGIVETGTFTFKDNKGCELAEEAKKDIANTKHIGDKSQKQNLGSIKKTLEENKNVKFSHGDENLKISYVEKSKQDPFIVDTGAAVDVSKLKFSEHVAIMTTTDVGNIEGQIRKWWSAAMSYNKDVNIPPDDTLSIGNRSINYKTFKKLVDDKILSETGNMEDAAKFNFNKNSINAIANSLMKADESGKYDIGLHDFKCHTIFADVEKAKEELWPPILDLIENQKNNKDNKMHIIVNRNIYYTDGTNTIDEEKNTNELRHTGFSIVCGGRCFVFETLGAIDLDKYIRTLPEEEQTSNKLEGNLFSTKSGIQKTTYDCNSITLGAIKNFIKSFTKDFGSDPELFSEYLSLFFSEKEQEFKTPFLFDEIVDTKKTEGRTAVYTGILPKEFFKYAQTVRGMNKVKEVIIEKLKETGIDDKKREALTKLGEKIDSINNKYVKAGLIKGCDNVYLPIGPQNMRARFERIKLLFDLGELENKGALDKSVLPTPKELAAKTANEKVKSRKALDFRNLTVSKIFKNIVEEAGKLAQADSNQARGKFREREGEKRKKNNAQEIKRS
ncbi:MAG: hypothetical protein LBP39_00070 [Rickettsiales bacterium]|jgi:hypothetical protein|nr:hypothetical protein [Rickettsiales bacterium]